MSKDLKILALIPARKGSKSIKNKNIISILGSPLISWSIKQALDSKFINRTIVSTNCEKIKRISLDYGAEVPFIRPDSISKDNSLDLETFTHALKWLKEKENYIPDLVIHLRPTGPARRVNIIDDAISKMTKNLKADSLRSVSIAKQTPYKMWFEKNNFLEPIIKSNKELHSSPRQELKKVYWQNGYVDITKINTILKKKSMIGDLCLAYEIFEEVVDIDYPEDIEIVEKKMKEILNNKKARTSLISQRHSV